MSQESLMKVVGPCNNPACRSELSKWVTQVDKLRMKLTNALASNSVLAKLTKQLEEERDRLFKSVVNLNKLLEKSLGAKEDLDDKKA